MHWPGKAPQEFTHRTSHHDVAPTLLGELFGCSTPPSDYSVGRNLFGGAGLALAHRGQLQRLRHRDARDVMVSQGGLVELRVADYRVGGGHLDASVVRDALEAMRRFYR